MTITPYRIDLNKIIAYPLPARGDTVWFYYELQGPAEVTIDIYNIAGEKGLTLTSTYTQSKEGRTAWDIRHVAPGIYFYRVRIKDSQGERTLGPHKLIVVK